MSHEGLGSNNHINKKTDSISYTKKYNKRQNNDAKRKRSNLDVIQTNKKASCIVGDNDAWRTLHVKEEPLDVHTANEINLSWLADERVCQDGLTTSFEKEENVPAMQEGNNFSKDCDIIEAFVKIETSVTRTEKPDGDPRLSFVAVGMDAGKHDTSTYLDLDQFQVIATSVEELKKLVMKIGTLLVEGTRGAFINKIEVEDRVEVHRDKDKKVMASEDNVTNASTVERVDELLQELQPWEAKLQQATEKMRNKLKNELNEPQKRLTNYVDPVVEVGISEPIPAPSACSSTPITSSEDSHTGQTTSLEFVDRCNKKKTFARCNDEPNVTNGLQYSTTENETALSATGSGEESNSGASGAPVTNATGVKFSASPSCCSCHADHMKRSNTENEKRCHQLEREMNNLLCMMYDLQERQALHEVTPNVENSMTISPATTPDELLKLGENPHLVESLKSCIGVSSRDTIRKILKTCMTKQLAQKYSYNGLGLNRKRNKLSFSDHKLCLCIMENAAYFQLTSPKKKLINDIQMCLRYSHEWRGERYAPPVPAAPAQQLVAAPAKANQQQQGVSATLVLQE